MRSPTGRPPASLRWLATKLVRGPEIRYVLGDLDEAFERDVERGTSRGRASVRYLRNVVHSALSVSSARRQGGMRGEGVRERIMASRRRFTLGISLLDLRLGVRMLFKYPGLTLVGTLAMSVAIATVAGFHSFTENFVGPKLPVPEGERVVGIWNVDVGTGGRGRQTVGDMLTWRDELGSIEDVGGFTTRQRVVFGTDGRALSVPAAQISPSAFRMLRVPPLRGRPLVDEDERPGGPAIALLGFDLWQSGFGADPAIVGKTIRLGGVQHSVVGVMPRGFGFPIREQLWTPIRVPGSDMGTGGGPRVSFSIGRLAPGVTLEEAEVELQGVGSRLAADHPETHAQLRPRIKPYARSFIDADDPSLATVLGLVRVLIVIVLIIAAVNVGTLVYARSAGRTAEISVRNALGASRHRIALQLFAEALVLASLAAAIGVGIAVWAMNKIMTLLTLMGEGIPYWWDAGMGPTTVLLVVGLILLAAVLTGILPALGVTGRRVASSLQRAGMGGAGFRFGKTASTVVVAQVAISVALLTLGGAILREFIEDYAMEDGIAREEYLAAEVRLDREPLSTNLNGDPVADFTRDTEIWRELGRRLAREPAVLGATFGTSLPGIEHPVRFFEAEGISPPVNGTAGRSRVAWVEPGYFDVFGIQVRAGRVFDAGDITGSEARVAIVNEAFVRRALGFSEPIGQRIRLTPPEEPSSGQWAEIVGVVPDVTVDLGSQAGLWPAIYFPLVTAAGPIHLAVHLREDPSQFLGRLRAIGGELDPSLVLHRPRPLAEIVGIGVTVMHLLGLGIGLLVLAALVLSTAGLYALMSFTVSQRTREIGIRIALGANPRRVVGEVFSRAIAQLALGTILGLGFGILALGEQLFAQGPGPSTGIAALILIMGLIACGKPVSRALRIEPTEALRADG